MPQHSALPLVSSSQSPIPNCSLLSTTRKSNRTTMTNKKGHSSQKPSEECRSCKDKSSCGHKHKGRDAERSQPTPNQEENPNFEQKSCAHRHKGSCPGGNCGKKHDNRRKDKDRSKAQDKSKGAKPRDGSCPVMGRCPDGSCSDAKPKQRANFFGNYWYGSVDRPSNYRVDGHAGWELPDSYKTNSWGDSGFSSAGFNDYMDNTEIYGHGWGRYGVGSSGNWWL